MRYRDVIGMRVINEECSDQITTSESSRTEKIKTHHISTDLGKEPSLLHSRLRVPPAPSQLHFERHRMHGEKAAFRLYYEIVTEKICIKERR